MKVTGNACFERDDKPMPNEHERQLALNLVNNNRKSNTPDLLTAIAKALAAYRVELRGRDAK